MQLSSGTVQETMLMCFLDRATYSPMFPGVLDDPEAVTLLERHRKQLERRTFRKSEMAALSILLRSRNFDLATKRYLARHPEATVVNLAAGLETNFSRVDNGRLRWYELDLPDAIDFRAQFLPESSRCRHLKYDVLDPRWMDEIEFQPERGLFIIASGIFCYFDADQLGSLLARLAARFPGGELIFESYSRLTTFGNNVFLRRKNIDARLKYSLPKTQATLSRWSERLQLVERFDYYSRLPRGVEVQPSTWAAMKLSDMLGLLEFVHVRFA